jgi:hypothetical protein
VWEPVPQKRQFKRPGKHFVKGLDVQNTASKRLCKTAGPKRRLLQRERPLP